MYVVTSSFISRFLQRHTQSLLAGYRCYMIMSPSSPLFFPRCLSILATHEVQLIPVTWINTLFLGLVRSTLKSDSSNLCSRLSFLMGGGVRAPSLSSSGIITTVCLLAWETRLRDESAEDDDRCSDYLISHAVTPPFFPGTLLEKQGF